MARDRPNRPNYHHGNLRAALVVAGLELTRQGGPSALGLRDVSRRVGVSPNAVYRHFVDRDDLLAAVATRIQQDVAERMHALQAPEPEGPGQGRPDSARDSLRAVGLGYISFALAEPGWFEVAFTHTDAMPVGDAPLPAPLAMLVSALDALVESGELDPAARPGAEWPCWSVVHGFASIALNGPLRNQPAEVVRGSAERAVDTVIRGLLSGA